MKKETEALFRKLASIGELTGDMKAAVNELPLRLVSFERGEEIVSDGEIVHQCCLLVEGFQHRSKILPTGNRQIFSVHVAGDIPDLHSLHLRQMDHSLTAMSKCRVAFVSHADLKETLRRTPALADLFWRETLIDSAGFRAWMLMLGQAQSVDRMAHLFCELYVRLGIVGLTDGISFQLPLTQADLGDMLGISVVHANRTLQELRSRGLIQFEGGRATILNFPELRREAQFDPAYLHYAHESHGLG